MLPPIGMKVLTYEPMMADLNGERVPVFARAMCEVLAHGESTMDLMVCEGDTMTHLSAAGAVILGVYPEQVVSREVAIAEGK
jgi:hypothetical protein